MRMIRHFVSVTSRDPRFQFFVIRNGDGPVGDNSRGTVTPSHSMRCGETPDYFVKFLTNYYWRSLLVR